MTARKAPTNEAVVTSEDAFGTPAAARGGMMTVAGAEDDDEELPLLTDDSEGRVTMPLGELRRLLRRLIKNS